MGKRERGSVGEKRKRGAGRRNRDGRKGEGRKQGELPPVYPCNRK